MENRCHRSSEGVSSAAGVAAEARGGAHLGKIGLQLLRSTDEVLTEVAGACRAARAALAGLRQRAEQKQGLHPRK